MVLKYCLSSAEVKRHREAHGQSRMCETSDPTAPPGQVTMLLVEISTSKSSSQRQLQSAN